MTGITLAVEQTMLMCQLNDSLIRTSKIAQIFNMNRLYSL